MDEQQVFAEKLLFGQRVNPPRRSVFLGAEMHGQRNAEPPRGLDLIPSHFESL